LSVQLSFSQTILQLVNNTTITDFLISLFFFDF
jgi:hypothetical protein